MTEALIINIISLHYYKKSSYEIVDFFLRQVVVFTRLELDMYIKLFSKSQRFRKPLLPECWGLKVH